MGQLDPWVQAGEITGCRGSDDIPLDEACDFATSILYELSGKRFGTFSSTFRPTRANAGCGCDPVALAALYGYTQSSPDPLRFGLCGCPGPVEVFFSDPVEAVAQVKVDGVVLVEGVDYALYDGRRLVRLWNGSAAPVWPCCQLLSTPADQPGTFEVTVTTGIPVPQAGKTAAKAFACWVAKQLKPGVVELPTRTAQVVRQNVSVTVLDPQKFIDQGRTGVSITDMWLKTLNPYGLRSSASVVSPDTIALPRS